MSSLFQARQPSKETDTLINLQQIQMLLNNLGGTEAKPGLEQEQLLEC